MRSSLGLISKTPGNANPSLPEYHAFCDTKLFKENFAFNSNLDDNILSDKQGEIGPPGPPTDVLTSIAHRISEAFDVTFITSAET